MEPGAILADRYRLVSLLGRGGMGEVWRAEHLGLRAPIAIKLMNPSIASDPDAMARFNREAQAAAALRSPHVVQILDHGVDPATHMPFIAMELMEGESLAHRLARVGRLSANDTARIVMHVARALGRAHELGIVHRDLKPDNIFLVSNEDEEIAKVLDFGIAKANAQALGPSSATRTGTVMGTPYYMSPEQITGAKGLDYRTDLWALGVIASECLTGRQPFEGDTLGALVIAICTMPPPPPSSLAPVPPGFDEWFTRATARNLAERFQSARELSDTLRQVLTGSFVPAPVRVAPTVAEPARVGTVGMPAARETSDFTVSPVSRTHTNEPASRAATSKSSAGLWVSAVIASVVVLGGAGWLLSSLSKDSAPQAASPSAPVAEQPLAAPAPQPSAPGVQPVAPASAAPPSVTPAASAAHSAAAPGRSAPALAPRPALTQRPNPALAPLPAVAPPVTPPAVTPKPALDSSSVFDRRKG